MNNKTNTTPITKTSNEWIKEEEYTEIIIMDPDGWDRQNYEYSFNEELITKEEFFNRLSLSTCMHKVL